MRGTVGDPARSAVSERPQVNQRPIRSASLVVIGLALAVALSACGRRGPLEPPPGAPTQPRAQASDPQNASTFAGTSTFRPARETETTANTAPEAPETPQAQTLLPGQVATPVGPQTISAGSAGLRTTPRNVRRSPPPTTPFILDPLL